MASSMLNGDRRWGQMRKSGMTVLGKVPKPINLPSQRLENHGLDPNVEIVPKGTLTWGSRSSSTAPNAWGSSSSPKTDGSTSSPSSFSGRPSSGGSFTRPSTSASDRSHQAASSAWGPNSRPSSASGILPSNQTSAAVTRPRSAETRPGALQLSSFAEPITECSPWGTTRITEKLVHTSKSSNFTLSSGDFPTLGSEKNSKSILMQQDYDSQGHPASASGRDTAEKKITEPTTTGNQTIVHSLDKGDLNTWRRDNPPCSGITIPPSDGNWHRDQQQMLSYPHANVPSHQFDSWHGPPMQSPHDGIWYRGGPPGGLMRPGGPTGSYPIEPYIYYPQLPARPLSNSQAGPRHGAPMGGFGPTSGAPYQPRAPDPYMVPNISVASVKPEVAHQVHYGHTGNDKDDSGLGISPCPTPGNQHLNQNSNVDSGNFYAVPRYYSPSMACEPVEDARAYESHGPQYKVLLKQHGACKDNDPGENVDQSVRNSVAQLEIQDHSGASRPAPRKGGKGELTKMGLDGVISHCAKGSDEHLSVPTQKNVDITTKSETVDDHCANSASQDSQQYSIKKSSALIEKIETLNNKARLADGHYAVPAFVEEKIREVKNVNIKVDSTKVVNTMTPLPEKSSEKVSFDGDMKNKANKGDTKLASTVDVKVQLSTPEMHTLAVDLLDPSDVESAAHSKIHKSVHVKQHKADYHTKSQFNSQDGEEWRKKSPGRGSTIIDNTGNCPQVQDCQPCQDVSEKTELHHLKVGDEPYIVSLMDPVDYRVQHAKRKEIARQRAKQLQEEEEVRIREQKARALAKLEELNRKTSAEMSNQKSQHVPPSSGSQSEQDAGMCVDSKVNSVARALNSGSTNAAVQKNESVIMFEESVDSSGKAVSLSVTDNDPSMSLKQDVIKREAKTDSQSHDKSLPKQKQMLHKKQDNRLEEKHVLEKNLSVGVLVGSIIVGSESLTESVPPSTSSADSLPSNNKDMDEPSMQHRKSNNRTTRNKNKLVEPSSSATLQLAHKVLEDVKTEGCKVNSSESVVHDAPLLSKTSGAVASDNASNLNAVSSNVGSTQGTTGGPGKASMQWKAQPPRRVTRNPQATKAADKFLGTEAAFWAPVKSTTKKESSEEVQGDPNKVSDSSGKNGNEKYRRAEMERYVPKPIAKEISQQANQQQPPSTSHQSASYSLRVELGSQGITGSGPDHSVTQKVGVLADTKNWEGSKAAKHGRTHTSWRRRGPPESSPLPGLLEGVSSDSSKDTPKNSCLRQPSKHDDSQEQAKFSDDGWNDDKNYLMQSESSTAPLVEKYHVKMNRGRRQPLKGHKVVGNNSSSIDNWEPGHGRTDKSVSEVITIEADESDGTKSVRNGNQSASDHPKSRWQPKSQAGSRSNHFQGMGESGEQKVASRGNRFDKESPVPGGGKHNQTVEGESVSTAGTAAAEIRNVRQNEEKRERRAGEESSVRHGLTEIHDSSTLLELAPQNVESRTEPVSSGTCRHGQCRGWFPRGHETSFGGAYVAGQDTGKHNLPTNVDRRKQYQRAGCYNKYNDSIQHNSAADGEAQDGSKNVGKYRERCHNNPRRGGHFNGRNRSSDAYGGGE